MLEVGVTAVMVIMECVAVATTTLSKAAMNKGMNIFVYVVYSDAFATTFILFPSVLFHYKNRSRPPLTASIICRIFLLSLIGCFLQNGSFIGIRYASPTLASTIMNLTPAFTFILAIISGMQKLDLRVQSSLAKSIGTLLSIAGALTVTLYKGPAIASTSSLSNLYVAFLSPQKNWVIGGLLLTASSLCLALVYIVQTAIIKDYPEELMVTFLCCLFVTFQSATVAIFVERNPNAWKIKPDIELIAIVFAAIFDISLQCFLQTWACRKKGPVYVSMFKPLGVVIAVVMGVTLLGDTLYFGSVVGAAIIVFGFYSVIWGQAQEEKIIEDKGIKSSSSSSLKAPLLENRSLEV